jgi:tetratricopeptide (TPR) repeat protein
MNKQELLKQADYTFQRGNRELAKKYLSDLLTQYPNEEAAWMLLARIVEEKERKIECYEHALKINPNNNEARIGSIRLKTTDITLPLHSIVHPVQTQAARPVKRVLRGVIVTLVLALVFGTTTYVVAMKNPQSSVGKLIAPATPISFAQNLPDDTAAQTRAQVGEKYPQYSGLVDTLIGFAVSNTESGMEGAPERPGSPIVLSEGAGLEAKVTLENALPQPGSLNTVTLTEQQITSWLAMEMKNSPDLPLHDVQVYLQNGTVEIWGMVDGSKDSTSALVTGKISLKAGNPSFEIESLQIGQQAIPGVLLSQAGTWLNQILSEKINEQVPGLQIMNVNISSGLITISGMR